MLTLKNSVTFYYAILVSGFFFLDKGSHRSIMYVGIALLLYYLYKNRTSITRDMVYLPLVLATIGYTIFTALSALWSSPLDFEHVFDEWRLLIILPIVLLPFMVAHKEIHNFWNICISAFVLMAVLSAVVLLSVRAPEMLQGVRMHGFWQLENPVSCGIFYGIAFLILLFCRNHLLIPGIKNVFCYGALTFIPLLVLFLTQARGPFLVVFAIMILLPIVQKKISMKYIVRFTAFTFIIVATFLYYTTGSVDRSAIERGSGGRIDIWQHALQLGLEKPIIGHGIASEFMYPYTNAGYHSEIASPHSAYFAAFVHTGLIGLTLQFLVLGLGFYRGIFQQPNTHNPAALILLSYGALIGVFDLSGYYRNLDITWILFWLPITLLAVRTLQNKKPDLHKEDRQ